MKQYLMEIAIGPVQVFIASARKLRDLWFGSLLLSELSKAVARAAAHHAGQGNISFIFPAVDAFSADGHINSELEKFSPLSVANKILMLVSTEDPAGFAKLIQKDFFDEILLYAPDTLARMRALKIKVNDDMFEKQLRDFGEFYAAWTVCSQADIDSGYFIEKRKRVAALLAGRKNTRTFEAPSWNGKNVRKCTLDGVRESVIEKKQIPALLKSGELLDAVSCIKRFYPLEDTSLRAAFKPYDLSYIALAKWIKQAKKTEKDLYTEFTQLLKKQIGDTAASDELLGDYFFYEYDQFKDEFGDESLARSLADLLKELSRKVKGLQPYACFILGDGDHMGAALEQCKTPDEQRAFSQKLSQFAGCVKEIVTENDGCLIYAGGDDVMAILPMETALHCSDQIRLKFAELLSGSVTAGENAPSFSIGMTVVHQQAPLDQVRLLAQRAESSAKNKAGRNALAVIQSKRSGSDIEVYGKWVSGTDCVPMHERLQRLVNSYMRKELELSAGLGYELRQISVETKAAENETEIAIDISDGKIKPLNAATAMTLGAFMQKKIDESVTDLLLRNCTSIRQMSDELVVAKQFASVTNMSLNESEQ